jgi:hypothetical protein
MDALDTGGGDTWVDIPHPEEEKQLERERQ